MLYRLASLVCCFFFTLTLTGCLAHPYIGKSLSSSLPHHKYYEGMPAQNSLCITSRQGDNVYFNYTLTSEGNTYTINGEMIPGFRVLDYPDINIHLLLVNKGIIVEAIRLNTMHSGITPEIRFSKTFTTDKTFRFITFAYNIRYS